MIKKYVVVTKMELSFDTEQFDDSMTFAEGLKAGAVEIEGVEVEMLDDEGNDLMNDENDEDFNNILLKVVAEIKDEG